MSNETRCESTKGFTNWDETRCLLHKGHDGYHTARALAWWDDSTEPLRFEDDDHE